MPLYVYEVLNDQNEVVGTYEVIQRMSDPALTVHPETGQTIRRTIQAPFVGKKSTGELPKSDLSNKNLDRLGFTKYQKSRDGGYEKVFGEGPEIPGPQ